jgi:hypothetical protein
MRKEVGRSQLDARKRSTVSTPKAMELKKREGEKETKYDDDVEKRRTSEDKVSAAGIGRLHACCNGPRDLMIKGHSTAGIQYRVWYIVRTVRRYCMFFCSSKILILMKYASFI